MTKQSKIWQETKLLYRFLARNNIKSEQSWSETYIYTQTDYQTQLSDVIFIRGPICAIFPGHVLARISILPKIYMIPSYPEMCPPKAAFSSLWVQR